MDEIFNFADNQKICRFIAAERAHSPCCRESEMTFSLSFSIKSNFHFGRHFLQNDFIFVFSVRYSVRDMCRNGLSPLRLPGKINKCQSSCHLLCRHVNCVPRSIFGYNIFFFAVAKELVCDANVSLSTQFSRSSFGFTDLLY